MSETIRCPCCDRPMQVERHQAGYPWPIETVAAMRRMKLNGIPAKVIGWIYGTTGPGVEAAVRESSDRREAALHNEALRRAILNGASHEQLLALARREV